MRPAVLLVPALLLASLAAPAAAGGPPGTVDVIVPAAPPPPITKRYGVQVALADGAWIAATMLLSSSDGGDGASLVALGYYGAGPAVHLGHGNGRGALQSLAARALLPVAGGLVGLMAFSGSDDPDDDTAGMALGGLVLGAGVGAVTAMVLDWTVFAKKDVRPAPATFTGRLRPDVKIGKDAFALGVGGSF